MSELVEIKEPNALEVFAKGSHVDPILEEIRRQAMGISPDVSTAKGRKEIASMAHKVAQSKTYLDGIGKKLTDEYKEIPKKIDANRKKIRDYLDSLKDEVRKPLTEWEDAEKARVQEIRDRIDAISQHVYMAENAESSESISDMINRITNAQIDDSFAEFKDEAQAVKDATLVKLYAALDAARRSESERAELQRLREEAVKREQEERERRIAEEAADKARREAEAKAESERRAIEENTKREREALERRELESKLAVERAERERIEAVERAEREKKAAVEQELKRIADEKERKKQDELHRKADEQNKMRVHNEIADDLIDIGIDKSLAIAFCYAASEGKIRNVKVIY